MARIYREIKQSRPYARGEEELLVTLMRTSDVLRHALERALEPWRISPEQYNVLRILRGVAPGGHPTLEIAERMVSRSPNISRMVEKMIRKGLIRRQRDRSDRRVILNRITPRGLKIMAQCDRSVGGFLDKLGCLDRRELRGLCEVLDRVRRSAAVETVRQRLGAATAP